MATERVTACSIGAHPREEVVVCDGIDFENTDISTLDVSNKAKVFLAIAMLYAWIKFKIS